MTLAPHLNNNVRMHRSRAWRTRHACFLSKRSKNSPNLYAYILSSHQGREPKVVAAINQKCFSSDVARGT
jgi:hypothetical protein